MPGEPGQTGRSEPLQTTERKGLLQIGTDADVTIIGHETITDRSTIEAPGPMLEGLETRIVKGTLIIDGSELDLNTLPGRAAHCSLN